MHAFGHLINPDSFNVSLTRPEMYEIFTNFYVSAHFLLNFLLLISRIRLFFNIRTGKNDIFDLIIIQFLIQVIKLNRYVNIF